MVYSRTRRSKKIYSSFRGETAIAGPKIDKFLGLKNTTNLFSMPLGQLQQNKNMEYRYSGENNYLETKRGSTLIKDILTFSYGAEIYTYNLTDEYFVWANQSGELNYCTVGGGSIINLTSALTSDKENSFFMYGLETISSIYGSNISDGVYKISGSTPSYSSISNSPNLIDMAFSGASKRLFGVYKHTLYWTEAQTSITTLANLEDWGWSGSVWNNSQVVSPDSGLGFVSCIESNQVMVLFKDSGIWGLVNSEEDSANWFFPKLSSDTGTKSKKTVQYARYGSSLEGVIFLGTDKTLRFLDVKIERNSGVTPSITTKNSHIISYPFQDILDKIPDGYLSKCTGKFYNGYYILNIVSENETEIDTTLVIDTQKLLPRVNAQEILQQPYWFESENMDYVNMVIRSSNNILYGFNKYGFISQLLVDNKDYEEFPERVSVTQGSTVVSSVQRVAIEFYAYTGWHLYSNSKLLLKSITAIVDIPQDYNLTLTANGFIQGEPVPDFDSGISKSLIPNLLGSSFYDVALFDVDVFSYGNANQSQNSRMNFRGNYFSFGVSNTTLYQHVKLYSFQPYFIKTRNDYVGYRE